MSPSARNPMDQLEVLLRRPVAPTQEDPPVEVDVKQINGREIAEHEVVPVLRARLTEREAAADGILGGLIKKPRL